MPTSANIAGNGVQGSLNEIVDLLQAELDELLQQKGRIRQHMRNLRRRLGLLQTKCNSKGVPRQKSRRLRHKTRRVENRKICHLHDELARACRIAFLEVGETATPDELCAAIVRRGSFSFSSLKETPTSAVARTLTSMAESGEVVSAPQSRWTYKANL